jgi:nucleoside-diphosphate-sugar epimerase
MRRIQPSHCLHLAWYTQPGAYLSSPENLLWTASSISLLHSFHQQGGQRFIGAGTCAEYDWQSGHCIEGVTPLEPATLYGICKNSFQKILTSVSANTAMSSAWGRIFFLYGPHENPVRLVPTVINALLHNKPAFCSHGNQVRDFMHVSDVANAFVSLLESNTVGPINIASGKPVAIKEVIHKIAGHLNSMDKIRLGALPARDEPTMLTADVTKLQSEIDFHPRFDLASGLEQTIEWWKKSLPLSLSL